MTRRLRILSLIVASVLAASTAVAADYPRRPIRLVVPWPPGGPTDAVARVLAHQMSERLGQQVVVENKAGATGTIGSDSVAKAAPDGYTVVVAGTASHPLAKVVNDKLSYDPLKDFRPIVEYGRYPVGLFVASSVPAKTLAEFIAYSKSVKDGLAIGIPGTGSVSHVYGQLLAVKTGAKLVFVAYRGDAPARTDLLAGNIQGISSTPDFQLIADGKARLIGSTGTKRWPQAMDVPTFAEAGHPELVAFIVWGLAAPAGTPDEPVQILNAAVNEALKVEQVKHVMIENAYFASGGTADALWKTFAEQQAEFQQMAKSGQIKFE
jgi:tripartite-type tricarboxylate transporter receptor subunit TctC